MNKSILMSIRPQYVAKILNGEKTIEIRKRFPKDYVGWVYIYCTKGKENLYKDYYVMSGKKGYFLTKCGDVEKLNGKVVARFWCDKIAELECEFWEEPLFDEDSCYQAVKLIERDLDYPDEEQLWNYHKMASNEDGFTDEEVYRESKFLQKCCLSLSEIKKYVGVGGENRCFGIHISNLKIFEEPKEISELRFAKTYNFGDMHNCRVSLTKAPQSYMFVEGE